ncbi:MAG TPA: pentapeptide repeat-containing protein [Hyphomicrobiaceae bacterium]|nr:pentapeptide repeat-containing protein [Hyphomicrobiaceae bacterium]
MDETSPGVADTETPVNPYNLLEAVNRSSASATRSWLIYIGLIAYLFVTVAGVSHKDLLLDNDVVLPILQVRIELTRFFLFAPFVLVLLHLVLLAQLTHLARKTLEFAASIRMLEPSDRRTHPLRLELDNFFFAQAIAGPERSRIVGALLHGLSWLTIVALPVALLLYMQIAFLPYHDVAVTWMQRAALLADAVMLALTGVFLWQADASFFRAVTRAGRHHPLGLAATVLLLAWTVAVSLLTATIPGETLDPSAGTAGAGAEARGGRPAMLQALADSALLGNAIVRSLHVTDADLSTGRDPAPGPRPLNLRNRDLQHARLDRSNLSHADLTGANLDGASFVGADLRSVKASCTDVGALILTDARNGARCASARGANFAKARLGDAKLAGVDLREARFDEARLDFAQLGRATLSGASLTGTRLDGADLASARLQGANLVRASLLGADLTGARLQMADLGGAALQGASLAFAGLEAASLRNAELDGANLQVARLAGADLSGARLQASDLQGAAVWRTKPPGVDAVALADVGQLAIQPPTEDEIVAFGAFLAQLDNGPLKARLAEGWARLTDAGQRAAWATSPEQQTWQSLTKSAESPDDYKSRLTEALARLMCRTRFAEGAVASGIARRAVGGSFKGDLPALVARLKGAECAATVAANPRLLRDLTIAMETAREAAAGTSAQPLSGSAPPATQARAPELPRQ